MTERDVHSKRSSHREALLEHLFAGEVIKHLWRQGAWPVEVLKPQVADVSRDIGRDIGSVSSIRRFNRSEHVGAILPTEFR